MSLSERAGQTTSQEKMMKSFVYQQITEFKLNIDSVSFAFFIYNHLLNLLHLNNFNINTIVENNNNKNNKKTDINNNNCFIENSGEDHAAAVMMVMFRLAFCTLTYNNLLTIT